jgi:hypothetical protein
MIKPGEEYSEFSSEQQTLMRVDGKIIAHRRAWDFSDTQAVRVSSTVA